MIALHAAKSVNGAQLYMECAQLNITGGSGTGSPKTYSIPGIYKVSREPATFEADADELFAVE